MHLIKTLQKWYKITVDWTGTTYCGLTLQWHYGTTKATQYVDISMPHYIKKCLHKFNHPPPKCPQNSPHPALPPLFGHKLQELSLVDISVKLDEVKRKYLQQFVGSILFYDWAVTTQPWKYSTPSYGTLQMQQNSLNNGTINFLTILPPIPLQLSATGQATWCSKCTAMPPTSTNHTHKPAMLGTSPVIITNMTINY